MRQPQWVTPVEDLREYLKFAVPLAAADLLATRSTYPTHEQHMWEQRLRGEIQRSATGLGHGGDQLTHTPRYPAHRAAARTAAGQLAYGIAAAALLAGPDGITAFGDHYGPRRAASQPMEAPQMQHVTDLLDELDALTTPRQGRAAG